MNRRDLGVGLIASAVASLLPHRARAAFGPYARGAGAASSGPAPVPQYYVSPTGDDNNTGTLASPWSITALNNNQATYPGKVIGFLPGTYQYGTKGGVQTTLYSLITANPNAGVGPAAEALSCQGGPSSSSPTYLCSCDSNGNYSPRTATIDCRQPGTLTPPTMTDSSSAPSIGLFGQVYGHPAPNVSQYGNLTFDGLVMQYFAFAAILLLGDSPTYYCNNVIVKNCDIGNSLGIATGYNNPGAVWAFHVQASGGLQVTNCKIHDLQTITPANGGIAGVYMQNDTFGSVLTNCTFYNCNAISNKDGLCGSDISYCYIGWYGVLGQGYYSGSSTVSSPAGTVQNYLTGPGLTVSLHHNILCGLIFSYPESTGPNNNQGTVNIYNNTFYKPGGVGGSNLGLVMWTDDNPGGTVNPAGSFNFWNNLVYAADANYQTGGPYALDKLGISSGGTYSTMASDHNAYGTGMTFGSYADGAYTLATLQALTYGYEASSISLSANPFSGTPTEPSSAPNTSFAISSSSPAYTAGRSGAICGAADGSGAIGCDF